MRSLDETTDLESTKRTHRTRGLAACQPLTSLQGDLFLTSRYDPFESAEPEKKDYFEGEALNREGSEI
jgi:hypothetical protein